ncbi:hypothetical protein SmJEL517_g02752 [Synchytrium microbalum]|uniref:Cation-transporting P-type ATPase N-terminal domain-containing protein n=1 Tax=Synchytrium microbalum TaxID=1806994 RepID=A0A507C6L6_9FUNG|nr:uncharacterized protein SmJEL517_g02752 [Synchytrium microbalum]TPX34759.1 hypothetical protein SmJEL517_g02752 [Synchytrium microbalum]
MSSNAHSESLETSQEIPVSSTGLTFNLPSSSNTNEDTRNNNRSSVRNNLKTLSKLSLSMVPVQEESTPTLADGRELVVGFRTYTLEVERTRTQDAKRKKKPKVVIDDMANYDLHKITVDQVFQRFSSHPTRGLDVEAATSRLARNGGNVITPVRPNYFKKLFDLFFGGFCPILWIACVMVFISWQPLGNPNPAAINLALAILLLIVIISQAVFQGYQDFTSSQVMKSITNMVNADARVTRDGASTTIPSANLVLGDLVTIKYGVKVPADLRIIRVAGCKIDKSILTGETKPIPACVDCTDDNPLESKNMAMMGTFVTEGEADGIVVGVGDNTTMGKIIRLSTKQVTKPSLLQIEISRFVFIVAILAFTTCFFCLILYGAWLKNAYPGFMTVSTAVVNAFSALVAFVPEGLPFAVTLTLTLVARRMYENKVLVKNLTTVETLGAINVLCSDKTGTLTTNLMVVASAAFFNKALDMDKMDLNESGPRELVTVASLCNNSTFDPASKVANPSHSAEWKVNGDATDNAILRFGQRYLDVDSTRADYDKLTVLPFNSKNKFMVSILRPNIPNHPFNSSTVIILMKGAPDILLPRCTSYIDPETGRVESLTDEKKSRLTAVQEDWGERAERVLLLAKREMGSVGAEDVKCYQGMEESAVVELACNLTVVGMVGIVDPHRPEIPGVVKTCRQAGIRLFMVTGDFPTTAAAIARKVGIFTHKETHTVASLSTENPSDPTRFTAEHHHRDHSLLLSGKDLESLTNEQWSLVVTYNEVVFARTTPEQKLRIVHEFQDHDFIVGVTGDGVNDSPALKQANIGVAMGSGSDVAMEAASLVLLDSNFASVEIALESGRLVFDNLKKVCLYLLPAGSFAELIPVLINFCLGVPIPLSPFFMIVICIFTDLAPALSLMYEPAEADLLNRPPRNVKKDHLVDGKLLIHAYLFIGMVEMICAHAMFFMAVSDSLGGVGPSKLFLAFDKWTDGYLGFTGDQLNNATNVGNSAYFVCLVVMQWGNLFATRTRHLSLLQHSPVSNPKLFIAPLISLSFALLVLYVPWFQTTFGTSPIPVKFWLIPIPFAIFILIADELRKLATRLYPNSFIAKMAW